MALPDVHSTTTCQPTALASQLASHLRLPVCGLFGQHYTLLTACLWSPEWNLCWYPHQHFPQSLVASLPAKEERVWSSGSRLPTSGGDYRTHYLVPGNRFACCLSLSFYRSLTRGCRRRESTTRFLYRLRWHRLSARERERESESV